MWTCIKCLAENGDQQSHCAHCGAPRNNRRFSPPAVQNAPQAPSGNPQHFQRSPRTNARPPRQPEWTPPPLSRAARLLRFCGGLLSIFLPLLCLLLCIKQYDVLYKALVPLLCGSAEQTLTGNCCYAFFCLCAMLLTFVPGLSILTYTCKYKRNTHREDSRLL